MSAPLSSPDASSTEEFGSSLDAEAEDATVDVEFVANDGAKVAGERWTKDDVDDGPCSSWRDGEPAFLLPDRGPKKKVFDVSAYAAKHARVERTIDGELRRHCLVVAWPRGEKNSDGREAHVARHIDDGWFRAIENTLARIPWRHLQVVKRIVIDDRPSEHGIAPFDRRSEGDERDGHTIWLHERLFEEPNHWARGNFGSYWSYHTNVDGLTLSRRGRDHTLFSPVLLHEIGHLVAYSVVNGRASNETVPACARICGDLGGCKGLDDAAREKGCISAYCMPFKFETGTENWAEQYRFFFQSRITRALLEKEAASECATVLATGISDGMPAPWESGLPDIEGFHRTLWKSCGGVACKAY